jgi:membrane protein
MRLLESIRSASESLQSRIPVRAIFRLIHWRWLRFSPPTRALPLHIWRAILNFKTFGLRNAAALAYYAVFSVFPLTLLLAVAISSILGPTVAQEQISQGLSLFLPDETETISLIQESVQQAVEQSRSFGLIGLVGLIWSALGLFSNLTASLDRIFQVPASRGMWRERMLAFLMTLALIGLVVVSFIASGILTLLEAALFSSTNIWLRIAVLFLPLGLNMVIFVLLFRFVPARHVNWDAIWPAALLGAAALELAKIAFRWYLQNVTNFQVVYSSIATVIVLMFWAFLTASVFLIAAEICAQLNLWFMGQHEEDQITVYIESTLNQLPGELPPPV